MEEAQRIEREKSPAFFKLWDLKNVQKDYTPGAQNPLGWWDYKITATTTKDIEMSVWNGNHYPSVEANCSKHICKAGTKVLVWMMSRFGDVGVTDNLINPKGYDARGLDADTDLKDYEFSIIKKEKLVLCHQCNQPILAVELGGIPKIDNKEAFFHEKCYIQYEQANVNK